MMRRRLAALFGGLTMAAIMVAAAIALAPPAQAALGLGMSEKADPQPWTTNGIVYDQALSEDGGTLYIGGRFNSVREKPPGLPGKTLAVNNVAAIDVETGAPVSTWKPAVTSNDGIAPVVRALAVRDGRVYIGGQFNAVVGQARRNLAAVDAGTGAVDAFAPTVGDSTSTVHTLAATGSRLYLGGKFASVDGTSRGNLAALDLPSGVLSTAWRARANELVRELEFSRSDDGTIFAVGRFDSVSSGNSGAIARQSVARFDAATGAVSPWAIPAGTIENPMTCWDATVTPTRLFAGCGLTPNFAAAFRLDNGDHGDPVWRTKFTGNVQTTAMSPDGSWLIVGGHFGLNRLDPPECDGRLKGLAALRLGDGSIDCSWIPTLDQKTRPSYDGAWTILSADQRVWMGGGFVGVSGEPRPNLARFTYDPDRVLASDATEPMVTRPRPAPGDEIRDRILTIRATVRDETDDLGSPDIDLYVDGAPKSFAYDQETDRLSGTTGRLPYGRHTVRVVAGDAAGNVATRDWSFRVVRR